MLTPDKIDFRANYLSLKGTRHILVQQEDGHWPPFAIVKASRTAPRDPRSPDRQRVILRTIDMFLPPTPTYVDNFGNIVRKVWCSRCGEWQRPAAFSPDKSRPNGLRGWCKTCCAEKQRDYRQRVKFLQVA